MEINLPYKVQSDQYEDYGDTGVFRNSGNIVCRVTQEYGNSNFAVYGQGKYWYRKSSNGLPFHSGIDLVGTTTKTLVAFRDGYIKESGWSRYGYGKHVIIETDIGFILYGHLEDIYVSKYEFVKKGDEIGKEGSTGTSTASHLHFEIRKVEKESSFNIQRYEENFLEPKQFLVNNQAVTDEERRNFQKEFAKAILNGGVIDDWVKYGFTTQEDIDHFSQVRENESVRNELYKTLLRRDIDPTGAKYWANKTVLDVFRGIRDSIEYKKLEEEMKNTLNLKKSYDTLTKGATDSIDRIVA